MAALSSSDPASETKAAATAPAPALAVPTPVLSQRTDTKLCVQWEEDLSQYRVKVEYAEYSRLYYSWKEVRPKLVESNQAWVPGLKPNTTYVCRLSLYRAELSDWELGPTSQYMTTLTSENFSKMKETVASFGVSHKYGEMQSELERLRDLARQRASSAEEARLQHQQQLAELARYQTHERELMMRRAEIDAAQEMIQQQQKRLHDLESEAVALRERHDSLPEGVSLQQSQTSIDSKEQEIASLRQQLEGQQSAFRSSEREHAETLQDFQRTMESFKDRMLAREIHAKDALETANQRIRQLEVQNRELRSRVQELEAAQGSSKD